MAEEHKVASPGTGTPRPPDDDGGFPIKLILLGLLGLYVLLFIILNSGSVSVSFVFFSSKISLVVGLVLAIALGFAGGYLTRELRERKKKKPQSS